MLTLLGMVIPAALIALAVRRWLEPLQWKIVLLCAALAIAAVGRGIPSASVPVPLDEVVRGWPYRGVFGEVKVRNALTNDTTKQILPWMAVVREELGHGRAPLWNRYLFCGYPLLGNGQSAPFSPFFLATLFVPLPEQLVAMAGLKLFVALLFGYLLLRREGAGAGAAMFGSAAFAFAVLNVCFLYYPMTAVTLLLPAATYAVVTCAERRRAAPFVLVAVVVAALLAGGHPESVVHVALAVVLLLAIDLATARVTLRGAGRATLAALIGALIAAPAWAPVVEQALISHRVALLKSVQVGAPFPRTGLWAVVAPDGFGNPAHGNWNWYAQYPDVASLYLGLIVLVLLPPALLSRQAATRDRLLFVALLVTLLIALGWSPLARLAYAAPPLSWVAHERLRFVVAFFAAVIAGRTLARLRRDDVVLGAIASVVAVAFFAYVYAHVKTLTPIAWSGVAALVIFWIVALAARRHVAAAAFLLVVLDLAVVTFDYNALTPVRYYAPRLPIIDALKRAAPREPYRVLGLDWMFLPNAAAQYGLEDVRGSDPMEWGEYAKFFRAIELPDASIDVKRIGDPEQPLLDRMNVRFLLTPPGASIGPKWRRIYAGIDGELYDNTAALGRFYAADPAVKISTWMPRPTRFRLKVEAPAATLIRSSQPAMPGWRVLVDGRPAEVSRVEGVFLGFFVPAGRSEVLVEYRDRVWRISLAASVAGILLLWSLTTFSLPLRLFHERVPVPLHLRV
jgi:hypothetical protein